VIHVYLNVKDQRVRVMFRPFHAGAESESWNFTARTHAGYQGSNELDLRGSNKLSTDYNYVGQLAT